MNPRLRGYVLGTDGKYRKLVLEERTGALCHDSLLGLTLRLESERLRLFDPRRGEYLLTHSEERQARQAVEAERDQALEAQRIAQARLAELERRLRSDLGAPAAG